ncbi:MAG: hypothetical protein GDA42_00095 [Ekhidna sp.]|nr:hypothetical protein [Ekhidna sp.]MBC6408860.1 hypothetical protein [Ekhidna sp.]
MQRTNLRFQVVLFGNFDDIIPNPETIKYFLESYADRNLIPNQFQEVNIDAVSGINSTNNRLCLTSGDQSWDIRFSFDRMDAILTNANIGVTAMEDRDSFIKSFSDIYSKFNSRFPRKVKRIGFVCQHLLSDVSVDDVAKKINKSTAFYKETAPTGFNNLVVNKTSVRIPEEELINVSSELRWIKTNLKIENRDQAFEGLLYATDINTIAENVEYRLDKKGITNFLSESTTITARINDEYFNLLK